MDLKLIGVGFGRTGTLSTRTALDRLGIPCYHMSEVLKTRGHLDFWLRVAESPPGTQHDWQEVFASYEATVDNPGATVWRELLECYPNAKVLLTLHPRGPEAWYESTWETIYSPQRMWEARFLGFFLPPVQKLTKMARKLVWDRFHRGTMTSKADSIERYEQHQREVLEAVPAERLLVFRASDGWQPLCDFLGVDVPDEPFPRVNERREMLRNMRGMAFAAYAILALLAISAVAALWLVTR